MIAPDADAAKKKKALMDNILAFKRERYADTRDKLVDLSDALQDSRQKTKLKVDAIKSVKKSKKKIFQKYIDSHVDLAYAKADVMIIEENKNSLFGTRENDHHFKRMEIEKKEKNLEDMLHEYRVGKEDFEERREAIFNECVRVKECSRQVSSLCRAVKDSMSWQIRNSTGENTDRSNYEYKADDPEGERVLKTSGGRNSTPGELMEHVAALRDTSNVLAERVLCARDNIEAEFSRYVKIHRGFESRPTTKHDADVLSGGGNRAGSPFAGSIVDEFFGTGNRDREMLESRPGSSRVGVDDDTASAGRQAMSGVSTPDTGGGPPVLSVLPSVAAIASMQVRTARSRRSMRGKHIENKGIEKCGADVLNHCADEGRLAELRGLKEGLETHILYQEAIMLVARNILLNKDNVKTVVHSDAHESNNRNISQPNVDGSSTPDLHGITVTDPEEYAPITSLLSRIPSAPPHLPKTLIKLGKLKASSDGQDRKDSNGKRKSGPLVTEDTDEDETDENSYLSTGNKYASRVQEATAKTTRKAYSSEASLYNKMTSGTISLVQPPVPSPAKPFPASPTSKPGENTAIRDEAKRKLVNPHWIEAPDVPFRDDSAFYATFLESIVSQTGGCEGTVTVDSKIPIELAATKLMVLNGTNAKKF